MERLITDFKAIVNFFCSSKNTLNSSSQEQRYYAEKLIESYNLKPIKKEDLFSCRINELTDESLKCWQSLKLITKKRFIGTIYEEVFKERFERQHSYIRTSIETHQSPSNYYNKLNHIYSYIFALAAHEGLTSLIIS